VFTKEGNGGGDEERKEEELSRAGERMANVEVKTNFFK
jgi:hypothetical protein